MRCLLDTHTLAWAVGDPSRLGGEAFALLSDASNGLLVSPVSIWEMSIKYHSGKWSEVAPFLDEAKYASFAERLGLAEFPIGVAHTRLAGGFDVAHKDPFDRLLAAQSLLGEVTLISKDPVFGRFGVSRVW